MRESRISVRIKNGFWIVLLLIALIPHPPILENVFAANEESGTLSLDLNLPADEENVQAVELTEPSPFARLWLVVSFLVYASILTAIVLYARKNQHVLPHRNIYLSAFPAAAKILITIVLFMFTLVHVLGLWDAYLQTHEVFESAEEYFGYMKLAKLVSLSHPHLFGFALMYLLVGGLFIFTSWSEPVKSLILAIPILSALFDVLSWWMIKMVSSDFELLTIFTGIAFGTGFGLMTLLILKEMWLGSRHELAYRETPHRMEKGQL